MALDLAGYQSSLNTFLASPTVANKAAVLIQRAALPDVVVGEGGTVTLPNASTLESILEAAIAATQQSTKRRGRLIAARTNFHGDGAA